MDFFSAMDISTTGLIVQRYRMNVTAENMANIESTRTAQGVPYRRKQVVLSAVDDQQAFSNLFLGAQDSVMNSRGVRVTDIVEDPTPFKMIHRPGHPDADQDGFVAMPNVNAILEMADMLSATRAYEANITAFSSAKSMVAKALELAK